MTQQTGGAAAILWRNWQQRTRIDQLPPDCRPGDRAAGYSAQKEIVRFSGQDVVGWKIAATAQRAETHRVDGPLRPPARDRVLAEGRPSARWNIMMVARQSSRSSSRAPAKARETIHQEEVLEAVESLHLPSRCRLTLQRFREGWSAATDRRYRLRRLVLLGAPTTPTGSRDLVAQRSGPIETARRWRPGAALTCSAIPASRSRGSSTSCARTPTESPPASSPRPAHASYRCRFSVATHFARISKRSGPWT